MPLTNLKLGKMLKIFDAFGQTFQHKGVTMDSSHAEGRVKCSSRMHVIDPATQRLVNDDARLEAIAKQSLSFISEEKVNRGSLYLFKFNLGITPVELTARVTQTRPEGTYLVCNAQFEGLPFAQRTRLNRFLSSKSPTLQRKFLTYAALAGLGAAIAVKILAGGSTSVTAVTFFAVAVLSFLVQPF